ncbi:MAG TPA: TIGR03936 family radical SAM-associated protein, partial [Armatimonadota bacterium]|nr:TIGR03936 family radical SAM-associated protein [Armatimonadota bacterium]
AALGARDRSIDVEATRALTDAASGPWGHIDTGITAEFRAQEMELAEGAMTTPDCREGQCTVCGLQACCEQATAPAQSRAERIDTPPAPKPPKNEDAPPYRAIIEFSKGEAIRFVSHLDVSRALQRAARRAGLPVAYTQGFNQRPRMTIARPLAVGVTGDAEPCAMELLERVDPKDFARALSAELPEGLSLRSVEVAPRQGKSPFGRMAQAAYLVLLDDVTEDALASALDAMLARPAIEIDRETKRGHKIVDIRPGIISASLAEGEPGLELTLICTDEDLVKPDEVALAINRELVEAGQAPATVSRLHRRRLLTQEQVR